MHLDMLLLQWPILIVARLLQIASHDYNAYIKSLRKDAIEIDQVSRIASAGRLYNPDLIVNGFLWDIGGNHAHRRTRTTIQRAQNDLHNAFDEFHRGYKRRHMPDMVIDVLKEVEEIFDWELYLQDDINEIQSTSDTARRAFEDLQMKINAIPNALITAEQHACYTAHRRVASLQENDERTVLDLEDISNVLLASMEVWCMDFLNPTYEKGDVTNAAILDAIQQPRTSLLSTEQQATLYSLTRDVALATSVITSILYFEMNDEDWAIASQDVNEFIRTIVLRASDELDPFLQRRSAMNSLCDARSVLQILNKAHLVFH